MKYSSLVLFSVLVYRSWAKTYTFPDGFKFGAASAAYQVEGGWNASDKAESIWDRLLHTHPEVVEDGSNGDVACDSYHLWRRDIEMAEELGLNMYRYSISWSRLLPSGFPNIISEDGKRYYNDLIDGLLEKGIEPVVTIYHWELPQSLQDLGGWANPLVTDWFTDYANVVFSLYADRVKTWLTINEAFGICDNGFQMKAAPNIDDPKIGTYICNKNALIAHAKAYKLYDEQYRSKYNGKVSIADIFFWFVPATPDDVEVTELTTEHWNGRYSHAIFSKEGGWPKKLEKQLLENGRREGYPYPRLPPFTPEETDLVRGTYDFYALNYYTTRQVRKAKPGETPGSWPFYGSKELNIVMESNPSWISTDLDWLSMYPVGLREQLQWLHTNYDVKEIIIMENGIAIFDPSLADIQRVEFIKGHLEQILLAISDGIPVTGYTAWTIVSSAFFNQDCEIVCSQYAQDPVEEYYEMMRNKPESKEVTTEKSGKRSKTKKPLPTKSYVMSRVQRRGIKLIKISVVDLCDNAPHSQDKDSVTENVILDAQYIVKDPMDSIMDETESLVKKISKSLIDNDF